MFLTVMDQMRCRDPERQDLVDFGKNCRDLGARWCMLMPKNRCGALYLHTITMHGGDFMEHLLPLKLTIGMLENSGAERRHQIGKLHFRKSLGGGGTRYAGMTAHQNRSAYLTLRGVLIWQYGRDLVAIEEMALSEAPTPEKASCRRKTDCGWTNQLIKISSYATKSLNLSAEEAIPTLPSRASGYDLPDKPDGAMQAALDARVFDMLDAEGPAANVYKSYVAKDPECANDLDETGGLQITAGAQAGQYIPILDPGMSEGDDQSGSDNDSDSPSSSPNSCRSDGGESGSEDMTDS